MEHHHLLPFFNTASKLNIETTKLYLQNASSILTLKLSDHCMQHTATSIEVYTVSQKKLGHFYFYCNFGKCWSIFEILSLSESERNGS